MCTSACTRLASSSSGRATTQAAGCPWATSRARFGPGQDPGRARRAAPRPRPGTCAGWSPSRCPWPGSRRPRRPPASGCMSVRTARNPCDGTAMKTMRDALERLLERRRHGQAVGKLRRRGGTSRSRASPAWTPRARANAPRGRRDARHRRWSPTAVPQDPAPITATRSFMPQEPTAARTSAPRRPRTLSRCRGPPCRQRRTRADADDRRLGPEVVLIPVKAFHQAKRRLGTALSDPDRVRARPRHGGARGGRVRPAARRRGLRRRGRGAMGAELGATVMWEPARASTGPCGPASTAWPGPAPAG